MIPEPDPSVVAALERLTPEELTVFVGPSLVGSPLATPCARLTVPPIRDGDLTALINSPTPPARVLVVDGYFGAGQAVNLTEIRDTLRAGVHLYGCSSMGALRAVEAAPWGMTGLGKVFAAYRDSIRTQDENVALLHDEDYQPLTVPTVNLDALCTLLEDEGAQPGPAGAFQRAASSLYFGDRTFTALRRLGEQYLPDHHQVLDRLTRPAERWRWDVKRQDAEESLAGLALGQAPQPTTRPLSPVPDRVDLLLGNG
ncbi:TfuA-like protein [Streptomyces sp. NPDC005438]|uniref:TfuA-like protein n=1 Tax=Streptomyces sp. NPDC005438 TaxID=3156880 RepID=UPI0033B3A9A6